MKTRSNSWSKRLLGIVAACVIAIALALSAVVSPISAFASEDGKYYPDFVSVDEAHEYGIEVMEDIIGESTALLKNNGVLPLAEGTGISIVGWQSHNMVAGGSGSGGSAGIAVDLPTALEGLRSMRT